MDDFVVLLCVFLSYFERIIKLRCGIPSVTLEGEKEDWQKLFTRIDKLAEFGAEPSAWANLLRPILKRFVQSFDGEPDLDFWSRICHFHPTGSGPTYLSGWVTAFCVWNKEGKWQGPSLDPQASDETMARVKKRSTSLQELVLDDVRYSIIDSQHVPIGFCEVDVKLDDNGQWFDCMMVAGHVASRAEGEKKDSLRPLPTWFMFITE